jgi:hypothetical protein
MHSVPIDNIHRVAELFNPESLLIDYPSQDFKEPLMLDVYRILCHCKRLRYFHLKTTEFVTKEASDYGENPIDFSNCRQ